MRHHFNSLIKVGIMSLICWLLASCSSSDFVDATKINNPESLLTPEGTYLHVAWLDSNQIAFLYAPAAPDSDLNLWDYQIGLYTLDTEEWRTLTVPRPEECRLAWWSLFLNRLPNGNLSFMSDCKRENEKGGYIGSEGILYEWDRQSDVIQLLHRYELDFHPTDFSFAPDMSQLIQETLSNELYRVSEEHAEQLFVDYKRVGGPSWSPDGKAIAFVGTKTMPEPSLNPFSGYPAVEFEAKYPWDLHLMDADGSNVRIILSGIRFASFVKWSPQGRLLAFRGEYKDEPGIWILDTETLDVIRVWTSESFYDWSPDGKRIVIIDEAERDGGIQTYPVIIDLPSDILKTDSSR